MNSKKIHVNYPLLFGGIIVAVLLVISIFGHSLAPIDPYSLNFAKSFYQNGEYITIEQQIPPNSYNILGTDLLGRDIFSQIIYGAGLTLSLSLLIVVTRLLVAIPVAFFAGFKGKISSRVIDFFSKAFSALPALIFCIFILSLNSVNQLELGSSILVFTVVLTFVGWGRLAKVLKNRIEDILKENFIQGEIAIGKSNFLISIQNVLPHLTATLIIYFFLEMGRVLLLIAELGIFQVYVGGFKFDRYFIYEDLGLNFMPSYYPEWGGLLGSGRYAITARKMWIALFPSLAFFISILGFNLFGEGLKIEVNKRTSRVITYIRKIPYYLSPKTFIYEIRNIKRNRFSVAVKATVLLLIIIIPLIPSPESLYKVDADSIFTHVQEFDNDKYEGRMTGTQGRDMAAEYIVNELKEYGIKPYFGEEYIKEFKSPRTFGDIEDSRMYIQSSDGAVIEDFEFRMDYDLSNTYPENMMYFMASSSGTVLTLDQYRNGDYDENKKYFIVFDKFSVMNSDFRDVVTKTRVEDFVNGYIIANTRIEANGTFEAKRNLIVSGKVDSYKRQPKSEDSIFLFGFKPNPITIIVNEETLNTIKNCAGEKMTLENDINVIDDFRAKNIGGIIEGKDTSNENTVFITTNYDYFGYEGDMKYKGLLYNGSSIGTTLEMAKILSNIDEKPEKTIVFLFFDTSKYLYETGSKLFMKNDFSKVENIFAITMNDLGAVDSDALYLDTSYAETIQEKYYDYVKYIKKRAKQLDIKLQQNRVVDSYDDISYLKDGRGKGILLKSIDENSDIGKKYNGMQQNDIGIIDKNKLKEQAQLILDTIIYITYGKK